MTKLGVVPSISEPVVVYCDNTGAIAQAKEPRSHHRSKHILRKFLLIREILQRKDVIISKIDTDENVANPFTDERVFDHFYLSFDIVVCETNSINKLGNECV